MKNILKRVGLVTGLMTVVLGVSAAAQTAYKATIPFDFAIGAKQYVAGEYSVALLSGFEGSKNVVLRDARGRNGYIFIPDRATKIVDQASLTFVRSRGTYTLAAIATPQFLVRPSQRKNKKDPDENESPTLAQITMSSHR